MLYTVRINVKGLQPGKYYDGVLLTPKMLEMHGKVFEVDRKVRDYRNIADRYRLVGCPYNWNEKWLEEV